MPVNRDKDGNVIVVPTRGGKKPVRRAVDVAGVTRPTGVHPMGGVRGQEDAGAESLHGTPTRLMDDRRGRASGATGGVTMVRRTESRGAMTDPPVGWLVVVDGPGRGSVATLGLGVNTIGRDPSANRVAIDHGDGMMSRVNHGVIVYDAGDRAFWIRHGDGTNLTFVDDEPVLDVRRLDPLAHIRMGRTVLRFVPLCGESFAWADEETGSG